MTLKNLREALLNEAQQEANASLKKADEEAQGVVNEEKRQGIERKKQVKEQIEKSLTTYHQERLAWAQLEARRILAEAKEDTIKAAIDDLYTELEKKKGSVYAGFLNKRIEQGLKELGEGAVVRISSSDRSKVKIRKKAKIKTDLKNDERGAIVESKDGKIRFNGTLEARLELLHEGLRKKIYEKLFGGENGAQKREKKN